MSLLPLTVACAPYDRINPLIDGRVRIEGCDVNFFPIGPEEAFARAYSTQDFDVTELSASTHILTTARGDSPYFALPVFVSRLFRHSAFYIRTDRGISRPEDLRGKLVGVPEYQMTAALWGRGILSDEYGVKPQEIRWRNGGLEQPGRTERTPITLPPEIELVSVPQNSTLSAMLEAGELDALLSARAPSCFTKGAPSIGRLFPKVRAAEEAYYRKTAMFPILHLIGVRKTLVAAHPWLALNIFKAFLEAREIAMRQNRHVGAFYAMIPFLSEEIARAEELMGPDFWPYGVNENRKEIDAMLRWSFEQGLSHRQATIEETFAPGTISIGGLN
jgi:4,5-dihydroxyphthalate decarboxylase